jgi:hemolysin activation/secretion protein
LRKEFILINRMSVNCWFQNGRRIAGKVLASLVLATALSCTALAVKAAPVRPDSGAVLEGAKPPEKPAESPAPEFKVTEPAPATADTTKQIHVTAFRFSGELPVPEAELQQVVAGQVGKDLTLNDLNQVTAQITHYLRGRGLTILWEKTSRNLTPQAIP